MNNLQYDVFDLNKKILSFLRWRFSDEHSDVSEWKWHKEIERSKLNISLGKDRGDIERGKRAGLYLNNSVVRNNQIVVNNSQNLAVKDATYTFLTTRFSSFRITCDCAQPGDSLRLGNLVFNLLTEFELPFSSYIGIKKMFELELGETLPNKDDKKTYETPVSFAAQWERQWTITLITPSISLEYDIS